jgi:hypothetical protein
VGERKILIAGSVIILLGVANRFLQQKPLDTPIIGGLALILLLAGLAATGPGPAELAGDFAMLALVAVILVEGAPLLQKASNL